MHHCVGFGWLDFLVRREEASTTRMKKSSNREVKQNAGEMMVAILGLVVQVDLPGPFIPGSSADPVSGQEHPNGLAALWRLTK